MESIQYLLFRLPSVACVRLLVTPRLGSHPAPLVSARGPPGPPPPQSSALVSLNLPSSVCP